jgi:ATP-binding cassette subfamily F protein 3
MLERLRQAKREQDEEIARVKMFIDRFRYQATKAAQVQSRIKLLEKVVPIEVPPERKRIHFRFPPCVKSGRTVLELAHASKSYGALTIFGDVNLHIERGDRIALVGPNGAGKSTLMRLLSGEEAPDRGERMVGHQVVVEYFAQDEATRLDPSLTVYETLSSGSPTDMVPAIRNLLGGFLFSGDDVYKKAGVLSGGERTRLAVACMLLRSSNTLLLDEPTNHLDLDSKDVLLEALEDYGGTLVIVSHDRYFVEKLATKIVEIGHGEAIVYPGTYTEFLWHKESRAQASGLSPQGSGFPPTPGSGESRRSASREGGRPQGPESGGRKPKTGNGPQTESLRRIGVRRPPAEREERKRLEAERRKKERAAQTLQKRISDLECRIAEREGQVKELEAAMGAPGFYEDRDGAKQVVDRHQSLMWEVGDLMAQWEALQEHAAEPPRPSGAPSES